MLSPDNRQDRNKKQGESIDSTVGKARGAEETDPAKELSAPDISGEVFRNPTSALPQGALTQAGDAPRELSDDEKRVWAELEAELVSECHKAEEKVREFWDRVERDGWVLAEAQDASHDLGQESSADTPGAEIDSYESYRAALQRDRVVLEEFRAELKAIHNEHEKINELCEKMEGAFLRGSRSGARAALRELSDQIDVIADREPDSESLADLRDILAQGREEIEETPWWEFMALRAQFLFNSIRSFFSPKQENKKQEFIPLDQSDGG